MAHVLGRVRGCILNLNPSPCDEYGLKLSTGVTLFLTLVYVYGYETCTWGKGPFDGSQELAAGFIAAGWLFSSMYLLVAVSEIFSGVLYRIQELLGYPGWYPSNVAEVRRECVRYVAYTAAYAIIAYAMTGRFNGFHTTLWWIDVPFSVLTSVLLYFPPLGTAFIAATTYFAYRKR